MSLPSKIELAEALADLSAGFQEEEKVPRGFHTVDEWVDLFTNKEPTGPKCRRAIERRLIKLVELGMWERQKFKIKTGMKYYPVLHYRKKK